MKKWQYKVYHHHEDWIGKTTLEEQLNNWYQDWELVTVIPKGEKVLDCIFKRKIQQSK